MSRVIVFATPVFLLLITLEFAWGRYRQRRGAPSDSYRLNDTLNSVSLGILSQLAGVFTKALQIGIYTLVFKALAPTSLEAFWRTGFGLVLALVFYDFCYYWLHRAGHEVALFWAAHVVHHQSQSYNLSTALRQTASGNLFGWLFYLPMAVAGVPPAVFAVVALIDLLYQFWVHTEHIGKLGWFDRVFCSPSNHRVHHAVNDGYLDRNYGGILVLWDRLFGSFREETEPCVYGTRSPLESWDPLWANAEVYWHLIKTSWHTPGLGNKLRVWLKPPGWQAPQASPGPAKPAFDLAQVRTFNPPLTPAQQWFAGLQFLVLLGAVAVFLWHADSLATLPLAVWGLALAICMWALGAVLQGRLHMGEMLLLESAVLATASATLGLPALHYLCKPLTMLIAIYLVAAGPYGLGATASFRLNLLLALACSLAGDVLLMLPANLFIGGLAAFLVVHGFYIALLWRTTPQQRWFPGRGALAGTLGFGAAMYALLWPGLPDPVLAGAVAVYVLVIACMAAQAIGRAGLLGTAVARGVAIGACFFMLSDSLIAVNRFVAPLPASSLAVLATYYVAQLLIARNLLRQP